MAQKIWSAEEFERLQPAEQDAIFESSIVHSPNDAPPEFIQRVRSRAQDRVLRTETPERR